MEKSEMFWQTYLNLEKELLEVSKFIYFTDEKIVYGKNGIVQETCKSQLETFSPHIADLLIRTCIEIEALSKELYFDFGGEKPRGDKTLFFDENCLKLIDEKCKSHNKSVMVVSSTFNFTEEENKVIKPLKEAHKRQGTNWERAYQAVKHDRYSSLSSGTVKNLIHAMGALYLLNIYYKDIKLSAKYLEVSKIDMSFGSIIFSLKHPDQQYVIDVINGKEIKDVLLSKDSPYILKYTDSTYKQVIEAYNKASKDRTDYLLAQPEFQEPAFQEQLKLSKEKEKIDIHHRLILTWELCQYRLNKRIPSTFSFEERKKMFINSNEWNGFIRKNNNPKKESELTEENIQAEIDHAGILAGMELDKEFDNNWLVKAFNEGYCELVLDKGDVHYNVY